MASINFSLIDGLKIGEDTLKAVAMRDATAGDIIEAQEESEKPVRVGDQIELIASPALVAVNVMRRQITKIGDIAGPLSLAEIKKLSAVDLNLLQEKSNQLETAMAAKIATSAVSQAGRP